MYDNALAGIAQEQTLDYRAPTYTERVARALAVAEQQMKDLKRMQEIFAAHPEFEELLTLVQRGRL